MLKDFSGDWKYSLLERISELCYIMIGAEFHGIIFVWGDLWLWKAVEIENLQNFSVAFGEAVHAPTI